MNNSRLILFLITLIISQSIISQEMDQKEENEKILAPSKAAFFSTILPGLGQAYNKNTGKYLSYMELLEQVFISITKITRVIKDIEAHIKED